MSMSNELVSSSPPTIGFLGATTPSIWGPFVEAFERRLRKLGWINGTNIAIDYRWAEGSDDRYARIADHFVTSDVDIIVTSGTRPTIVAANATGEIPIVFAAAGDVESIKKRPNVHGLSNGQLELANTRLELMREAIPGLQRVIILLNPSAPNAVSEAEKVQKAAAGFKLELQKFEFSHPENMIKELGKLLGNDKGLHAAVYVCTDPLVTTYRNGINTLALLKRLPTMHAFRDYVDAGGTMSYGPNFQSMFRHAADLVDSYLRENKLAPISTEHPEAEIAINRTSAEALDLKFPPKFFDKAKVRIW